MRFRLLNIPNTKGARKNRLVRKIGKRLDREIPKRKWGKILSAVFGLGIILIGAAMDGGRATEVVAAALPDGWVWCDRRELRDVYAVPNAFRFVEEAVEGRLGYF